MESLKMQRVKLSWDKFFLVNKSSFNLPNQKAGMFITSLYFYRQTICGNCSQFLIILTISSPPHLLITAHDLRFGGI